MAPTFLFLLILSVTGISLSAPIDNEDQAEQFMDISGPRINPKMPVVKDDIALPDPSWRNADPCTAIGCKWPKTGSYVYVPYYISPNYTTEEHSIIIKGLQSFNTSTCIRLVPWNSDHRHYLYFESLNGCWSYVGRQNGVGQYVSLQNKGCLYHSTVQHEVLHALGFRHEQNRSDRDTYIRILTENIIPEFKFAFDKVETNNLRTPYDFNSVMQYHKYAFSKNGKPTLVAKCDANLDFGHAKQMSINDITRVNRLYECRLRKKTL